MTSATTANNVAKLSTEAPRWEIILDRVKRAMASAKLVDINPARIRPVVGQPREYFDQADLEELADSIVKVGQIMPGIIRSVPEQDHRDRELLDGERRWRSVVLKAVPTYRALEVEIDDEAAPFVIASIANFNRAGHTHMEISNAIERLHNQLSMPMPVIAKLYNITVHWAYELHSLQKLDAQFKPLIDPRITKKDQRLPVTAAIQVSKLEPTLQGRLVQRFREKKVTLNGLRREAVELAKQTGTYIRERVGDEPARKAKRVDRLSQMLVHTATDLRSLLREPSMAANLRLHAKVIASALTVLGQTRAMVVECEAIIRGDASATAKVITTAPAPPVQKPPPPSGLSFAERFARDREKTQQPKLSAVAPASKPEFLRPAPVRQHVPLPDSVTVKRPEPPVKRKLPDDAPRWMVTREITVSHDNGSRVVTSPVSLDKYIHLWAHGLLAFQQNKKPKPDFLPTREEVATFVMNNK